MIDQHKKKSFFVLFTYQNHNNHNKFSNQGGKALKFQASASCGIYVVGQLVIASHTTDTTTQLGFLYGLT